MFCRRNLLLLLFSLMGATGAMAQVGQSPYTTRGIGNINSMATTRNIGMGGVGIGNTHPHFISLQNPALLGYTAYYTTATAGFSLESRTLATELEKDRISSGGFDYLAIAFPLLKHKIAFNVGLAPYSTVSYNLKVQEPIQGLPNNFSSLLYQGNGGLTQAYAASGINIYKGITAGARISYIFGSVSENVTSSFAGDSVGDSPSTYTTQFLERTSYSDISFTGGLGYRKDLKEQRYLMLGLTYELETNLSGERNFRTLREQRLTRSDGAPIVVPISDTLAQQNTTTILPAAFGIGISYGKTLSYTLGADFKVQNWERYSSIENGSEGGLGKSYRLNAGGEWTPNFFSRNYFSRMTYRTGVQVERTPYLINGDPINEFGINFGITFPVGIWNRQRDEPAGIHTSFTLGQRGKTEDGLIRERFFRISLGINLNDRWFERSKFD